jgi:hypothetical protein
MNDLRKWLVACSFLAACGGGGGGGGNTNPKSNNPVPQWPARTPDSISAVASDATGNIYITGRKDNVNDSPVSYVAEFDQTPKQVFSVDIQDFQVQAIAVDQKSGDVYVAGNSNETAAPNWGQAALVKLDSKGNQQWFQTIARSDESKPGALGAESVALDGAGNPYIVGISDVSVGGETITATEEMLVAKYDPSGTLGWVKLIGAPDANSVTDGFGVAADAQGNVWATGYTDSSFAGNTNAGDEDFVTVKLDTNGNMTWAKELGTSATDQAFFVAADTTGNAYVAGVTMGDLEGTTNAGGNDVVVVKYDSAGNEQWSKEIGSDQADVPHGVVIDSKGNAVIAGTTEGNFDGGQNAFPSNYSSDMFVMSLDPSGKEAFPTTEYGTDEVDDAVGLTLDPKGNIYVAGDSGGEFTHPDGGLPIFDAGPPPVGFIARFSSDGKPF